MQQALIEQSAEEPCYYAQLPQAKWPPMPKKAQTGGLFARILDRDECGATPHNSDASVVGETDLPDCTVEQKECVEGVLAEILKNILASASSGDTVLTAKPRNIIQEPN